ncbi:MAG: 30S ribosomal protein S13 [Nanoarchaeota archaeon]
MPEEKIKHIVRLINTDLGGNKQLYNALTKVKGVSYSFANAVCNVVNIDKAKKIGILTKEELAKIEDAIKNPSKYSIPAWLFNRRKDLDTGKDIHLLTSDLSLRTEFDIKNLKKIKSYRGIRHAMGLPVRGQKTRAHFRKGAALGVQRKKVLAAQKASKTEKKEK